jgi:hypothetical protein
MSSECTCNNAACNAKVCATTACACGFSTTGATCDGEVAAGVTDKSCPAGCDGAGACEQPLLWFKFEDTPGAAPANSGTWPGTITRSGGSSAAGKIGNALELVDLTDGIVIDDPADNSLDNFTSWTIEAWVNFAMIVDSTNITFAKKDVAYLCRGVASNNQFFHQAIVFTPLQQPANFAMPVPPANTWNHAACTSDANQLKLYWNGALVATAPVNGATSNSASGLGIGQSSVDDENLLGRMDEFRLWTTTRSDRQICLAACGSFNAGVCTFDNDCSN